MTSDLERFRATHARIAAGDIPHKNRRYAFVRCVGNDYPRFEATLWVAWREGLVDLPGDFFLWQHMANRPEDYAVEDLVEVYRQLAPSFRTRRSRYSHAISGWHGELDRLLWPRLDAAPALIPLLDEVDGFFRDALAYALVRHGVLPASVLSPEMMDRVAEDLYRAVGTGDGFKGWQTVWPMETFGPFVLKKWLAETANYTNHRDALSACARHAAPANRLAYIQKIAFLHEGGSVYDLAAEFADELTGPLSQALDEMAKLEWPRPCQAGVYLTAAARGEAPARWDVLLGDALCDEAEPHRARKYLHPLLERLPSERRQAIFTRTDRAYPWRGVAAWPTAETAAVALPLLVASEDRITDGQIEAVAALWSHVPEVVRGANPRGRFLRSFFAPRGGGLSGARALDTPGLSRWLQALTDAQSAGVLQTVRYLQDHWNDYKDPFDLAVPLDDQLVGLALWGGLFTLTGQAYRLPSPVKNLCRRLTGNDRNALVVALQEMAWLASGKDDAREVSRQLEDYLEAPWAEHAERFLADGPRHPGQYITHLLHRKLDEWPALIPLAVRVLGSKSAALRGEARSALARLGGDQRDVLRRQLGEAPINIGIAELLNERPQVANHAAARAALDAGQPRESARALLTLIIGSAPIEPDSDEAALVALDPGPTVETPTLRWAKRDAVAPGAARWLSATLRLESEARHHPALSGLCARLDPASRRALLATDDRLHTRVFLDPDGVPGWCARIDPIGGTRRRAFYREVDILRRSRQPIVAWWLQRWARTARSKRDIAAAVAALRARIAIEGASLDALAESAVPDHGFSADGTRAFGDVTLHLCPSGEVKVAVPGRPKLRKSLPPGHGDAVAFRALKKTVAEDLMEQSARLSRAVMSQRAWSGAALNALQRHPLHGLLLTGRPICADDVTLPTEALTTGTLPTELPDRALVTLAPESPLLRRSGGDPLGTLIDNADPQPRRALCSALRKLGFLPIEEDQRQVGGELHLSDGLVLTLRLAGGSAVSVERVFVSARGRPDRGRSDSEKKVDPLPPVLYSEVTRLMARLLESAAG